MNQLFCNIASGNAGETEWFLAYWNSIILARCRSSILLPLKFVRHDMKAQLIQNSNTSYHLNKERTRKKQERGKKEQWWITWPKEKGAKILWSVAAFLCKAEWIDETAPKWTCKNHLLKKSSNYVRQLWSFLKSCSSPTADRSCVISP